MRLFYHSTRRSTSSQLGKALIDKHLLKQRLWGITVAVAMLLITSINAQGQNYTGGTGTSGDPYQIASAEDLQLMATRVNGGTTYSGIHFKLTQDIDLSSVCGVLTGNWVPIGKSGKYFKGNLHGGGHTISNLYYNSASTSYCGLFGNISNATIDSVCLVNTYVKGSAFVAGLCGMAKTSQISHVNCYGNIVGTQYYVGGVCGYADDVDFSNSSSGGSVIGLSGVLYVGGFCGDLYANSTITHCSNSGSVCGHVYVGGICGVCSYSTSVSNCVNYGSVSGTIRVGGVCGGKPTQITNCYYDKQMSNLPYGIGSISDSNMEGSNTNAEGK